ncbi:electron transfer flavoprotein subunit beta/FixA family protein [Natranaerofaba carboxydovora]|uniref:electron transfer flavoprotein subunit beta/FixA family protein n=1 Tax=Natranaerofaba carboxydovora TaxID=2742683 RepID=UPI001F143438|nr:electron transfer flavoprotein subunit beta/FixA family protein [Natranaerofaba carboxydovora]UMZ74110.1 Caffeyl-CoA reductase-Etf complex subunit CarD [Natranaerofaba carboxydovora]
MKIGVLIKQVPDMEKVKFDTEKGVVDRKSAGTEVNPFDLNALETAVQIKEKYGGEITAFSMGPSSAKEALKDAISRGADDGILLNDRSFAGSDTWSTSFILSNAIKKIKELDLIITGVMSVDGDTAQVGPQVAEFLDLPNASFVSEVKKVDKEGIEVVFEAFDGSFLTRLKLPALISVTKDINNPRLPLLRDKLNSRKTEIPVWGREDIGKDIPPESLGIKGSPTKVKKIVVPPPMEREGKIYDKEELDEGVEKVLELFKEFKFMEG